MKKIIFLIFISLNAFANKDLIFSIDDQRNTKLSFDTIRGDKPTVVDFYNHLTRKSELYKGVLFQDLINKAYPKYPEKFVEVELISENGFKSYFPFEYFLKVNSFITYDRADNEKFERFSRKEKKIVNLGPYYLVWDLKSNSSVDRNLYSSVYQIAKINLITNAVDFKVSESKLTEGIVLGFRTYKRYCLSCHAIGLYGGEISTDLTKGNLLEAKGQDFIAKYALDPMSINPNTKMIGLPKYKNKEDMAKSLYDFLVFAKNPEKFLKEDSKNSKSSLSELSDIMKEISTQK